MSATEQGNCVSGGRTDQLCDFCDESKALLYCRADSAKLCFSCDLEVHSTNPLFRKHVRSLLCNSCSSSPSSIFCCTDSAVLCQNCDWETHRSSRSIHDRRPVEGFSGCPSVSELLSFLGLEDVGKKSLCHGGEQDDDLWDSLVWETPLVASLDDVIVAGDYVDAGRSFRAMEVPPLPKNRNAACGKHKEEVFRQLREMAKNDPNFTGSLEDLELNVRIQSQLPGKYQLSSSSPPPLHSKTEPISVPSYEANSPKWSDFTNGGLDESFGPTYVSGFDETSHLVPDKDLNNSEDKTTANGFQEIQWHSPLDSKIPQVPPVAGGARELNTQERDSAILRYKEKRKIRRYDKHIRYESRKARAETRTRVRGRFAKIDR